jgi:Zn-dependent protease
LALPSPGAGRKGLATVTLFGFPVTIHASFLIAVLLLGYSSETGVTGAVVWLVIVTVSVVAHELGHAFVAAPVGGEPRIDLYMIAGLTTWQPQRAGRGRRVAVSVAGPAAGIAFGIALLFVHTALHPVHDSLLDRALLLAVFANFAWGVLNLLPILPLDGGQVVYALMPGDEPARRRRTAWVSVVVAAAVLVVLAVAHVDLLAMLLVVFFAAGNVQTLMGSRTPPPDPLAARLNAAHAAVTVDDAAGALALLPDPDAVPPQYRPAVLMMRSRALLHLGRDREAQDTLLGLPPGARVDPAYEAALLLANGQPRLARERFDAARASAPDWAVRDLVGVLVRQGEDVDGWLAAVGPAGAAGAMNGLYYAGRYAEAAQWGERALAAGVGDPYVAFNVACSWARAGDTDRALAVLGHAERLGLTDVRRLDTDPDLAPVRERPEYAAIRQRIIR